MPSFICLHVRAQVCACARTCARMHTHTNTHTVKEKVEWEAVSKGMPECEKKGNGKTEYRRRKEKEAKWLLGSLQTKISSQGQPGASSHP